MLTQVPSPRSVLLIELLVLQKACRRPNSYPANNTKYLYRYSLQVAGMASSYNICRQYYERTARVLSSYNGLTNKLGKSAEAPSYTMLPSLRRIVRGQRELKRGSWVTITIAH